MRVFAILLGLNALACAQIRDLVTTDDGGQTYFSATYRQKGSLQPGYLKIFRLAENGLQLFRQFDYEPDGGDPNFYLADYPSISGDGRVVAYSTSRTCSGGSACINFISDQAWLAGNPDRRVDDGIISVSPDGMWYMVVRESLLGPTLIIANVATGTAVFSDYRYRTVGVRQALANGPVALLVGYADLSTFLWKAGQTTPLTLQAVPFNGNMDANGTTIVYEAAPSGGNFELHSYSVESGTDVLLVTGGSTSNGIPFPTYFHPWLTRDGSSVSYILNNQLYIQSTSGGPSRALTDASDGVMVDAVIAGWGNVAFAATSLGRLLRIDVASGAKTELIAAAPHLEVTFGAPVPGGRIDVTVTGPADGDPAITGAGVSAPVVGRSDNVVTLQLPWEAEVGSAVDLLVPGNASAFEEVHQLSVLAGVPTFYTLPGAPNVSPPYALAAHQDFSGLVSDSSPAQPGEIVHIYATDLGAVSPGIATGAITPTGTLYMLQTPPTCDFRHYESGNAFPADVLFAGLAPGTIGVEQLDVLVPAQATAPAVQFECYTGPRAAFGFTQLPIAPTATAASEGGTVRGSRVPKVIEKHDWADRNFR